MYHDSSCNYGYNISHHNINNSCRDQYNNSNNLHFNKWVRNLLGTPLREAQVSLLAHGPNFAVAPRHPPYGEYITAVELDCLNLEPHGAEELRAERRGFLKHSKNPKRNISKEEVQALAELKKDQSRVILTADKGVAIVVMDRKEYSKKAQELLEDGGMYKIMKSDPTNRIKNKLINLLKKIKAEGASMKIYTRCTPQELYHPNFMGYPKYIKETSPSGPLCPVGVPSIMKWSRS